MACIVGHDGIVLHQMKFDRGIWKTDKFVCDTSVECFLCENLVFVCNLMRVELCGC